MIPQPDPGEAAYVLRVHNAGSHSACALFVRPSGSADWGADRLTEPLRPDTFADFVVSTADRTYDVRAVYEGEWELTTAGVDVLARDVLLTY